MNSGCAKWRSRFLLYNFKIHDITSSRPSRLDRL